MDNTKALAVATRILQNCTRIAWKHHDNAAIEHDNALAADMLQATIDEVTADLRTQLAAWKDNYDTAETKRQTLASQFAERDAQLAEERSQLANIVVNWASNELAYCRAQKSAGAVYILEKLLRDIPPVLAARQHNKESQ